MLRVAFCTDPAEFTYLKGLLVESARARGHAVKVIRGPGDLDGGERFDVGVVRSRDSPIDPECCEVARELESRGVPFLNTMVARDASRDKLEAARLFERAGVSQPAWLGDAGSPQLEGPVIVKPRWGGRGEGIKRFSSIEHARSAGLDLDAHLVQRYHPHRAVWRVIATPDRALRAYRKSALPSATRRFFARRTERRRQGDVRRVDRRGYPTTIARDFISAQGELRMPLPPPLPVAEAAIGMVRAVDGDLMGADVIVADGRPLALELNTNFSLQVHDVWLFRQVTDELERAAVRGRVSPLRARSRAEPIPAAPPPQ